MTMMLLAYKQLKEIIELLKDYKRIMEKYSGLPIYVEIPSIDHGYSDTGIEEIIIHPTPIVLHVESSTLELCKQTGDLTTTK